MRNNLGCSFGHVRPTRDFKLYWRSARKSEEIKYRKRFPGKFYGGKIQTFMKSYSSRNKKNSTKNAYSKLIYREWLIGLVILGGGDLQVGIHQRPFAFPAGPTTGKSLSISSTVDRAGIADGLFRIPLMGLVPGGGHLRYRNMSNEPL